MTIAAGFVHEDGVIVCGDTQMESWNSRTHEAKVGDFDFHGGKLVYAMAGNSEFARAAMDKCKRELQGRAEPMDAYKIIETTLSNQYRYAVHGHPHYDGSLDYWLVIGLWTGIGFPRLYVTSETEMRQVQSFHCVGSGEALANHLLRLSFSGRMKERELLAPSVITQNRPMRIT